MDWSKVAEYWWAIVIIITAVFLLYFFFPKKESEPQEVYGQVDWGLLEITFRHTELEEVTPFRWSGQGSHDTGAWLSYNGGSAVYKQIHAGMDEAEIISATVKGAPTCEVTYKNGEAVLLTCAGLKQREFSVKQRGTLRNFRDRVRLHASFSADETPRWREDKIWPSWSS